MIKIPRKPNVRAPAAWSWSCQQIHYRASSQAIDSMLDLDSTASAWSRLTAANELHARLASTGAESIALRCEHYALVLHFIASAPAPADGASSWGLPIDRAHARLYCWLNLFAERVTS